MNNEMKTDVEQIKGILAQFKATDIWQAIIELGMVMPPAEFRTFALPRELVENMERFSKVAGFTNFADYLVAVLQDSSEMLQSIEKSSQKRG